MKFTDCITENSLQREIEYDCSNRCDICEIFKEINP